MQREHRFRRKLRECFHRRACEAYPEWFRRHLRFDPRDNRIFGDVVQPWQATDLAALDAAWLNLARPEAGHLENRAGEIGPAHADSGADVANQTRCRASPQPIQRAWIERPRGHSKTFDMAVQLAWVLLFSARAVRGIVAACDLDQGRLVLEAVHRLAAANPTLFAEIAFRKDEVRSTRNRSSVRLISSDVNSSFGELPDFVVCDELCHWERPELWQSLISSAAKQPRSVLCVLTNAGVGRGWQWDVRERARESPHWYFSSLDGVHAPWIEERWLDEQRALLPGPVYARLWENRWQQSDGGFVTLAEAEACRDESLAIQPEGRPGIAYVAAIDYAEKHDHTVGVVAHHDGARVVVDRMDVVVPTPDRPTPVVWVERWIERIARDFGRVTFVVDPYQLVGTIQRFESLYQVERFEFAAGRANHELATTLRRLILNRGVAWPPGCGAIDQRSRVSPRLESGLGETGLRSRDDLETELASLLLRHSASGRVRIDHHADGVHHDDRSFALGVACLSLARDQRPPEWIDSTGPIGGEFAW